MHGMWKLKMSSPNRCTRPGASGSGPAVDMGNGALSSCARSSRKEKSFGTIGFNLNDIQVICIVVKY